MRKLKDIFRPIGMAIVLLPCSAFFMGFDFDVWLIFVCLIVGLIVVGIAGESDSPDANTDTDNEAR